MIAPEELRVGNYILVNGSIMKIGGFNIADKAAPLTIDRYQGIRVGSVWYDFVCCDPILLTPEILKTLGFSDKVCNGLAYRLDHGDKMEFAYYVQDGYIRYQTKLSGFTLNFDQAVKNLHHFQNLYYFMTRQEIETHVFKQTIQE